MGRDKALIPVGERPLASVARDALVGAGAREVLAVGGDSDALRAIGFDAVADQYPGEGPLGGIVTALDRARHDIVVVLACDLPDVASPAVCELLKGVGGADAAIPEIEGHLQVLLAAYRRSAAPVLRDAFEAGERAPHRALAQLNVNRLVLSDSRWARDVDRPEDLP
jgi:molybdopterin-guanine dinucleotide biosynthesis protein A